MDPGTINALDAIGVSSGWDCLEVGASGGSIADRLCTKVGLEGKVTAVDLNTRLIDVLEYANLEARKLNVVTEDLPRSEYDLVHARFLLAHLPERESVLAKLSQTLWPGGGGYWSKNPISARRNQTPQEKLRCDGCSNLERLQFTNIWITEVWTGILGVGCSAS